MTGAHKVKRKEKTILKIITVMKSKELPLTNCLN